MDWEKQPGRDSVRKLNQSNCRQGSQLQNEMLNNYEKLMKKPFLPTSHTASTIQADRQTDGQIVEQFTCIHMARNKGHTGYGTSSLTS